MSEAEEVQETQTPPEDQFFGVKAQVGNQEEAPSEDVEVIDDTPAEEQKPARAAEEAVDTSQFTDDITQDELESYGMKVQKRINKLRAVNHEDKRKRGEAERQAQEAVRVTKQLHSENLKLKTTLQRGENALISSVKKKTELQLAEAENSYKLAHEEGDTEKIVQAQKSLNNAQAEHREIVSRETQQKRRVQAKKKLPPAPPKRPPAPAPLDPRQQQWMQQNPWFKLTAQPGERVDPNQKVMTAAALAVHDNLMERGTTPSVDADAYYQEVDTQMRGLFPNYFSEGEQADVSQPASTRGTTNVVAPSTRNNGARGRKVKLTKSQADIARQIGVSNKDYADAYLKLQE